GYRFSEKGHAQIQNSRARPIGTRSRALHGASLHSASIDPTISQWSVIMPAQTHLFRCLQDNYGVLVHDPSTGATASIDAPEAAPAEAAPKATGWRLTDILVTHHHGDHTGGIVELKQHHHCRVTAPRAEAARIPAVDVEVKQGDEVKVGALKARVLETPGHTAGHIAYWLPDEE